MTKEPVRIGQKFRHDGSGDVYHVSEIATNMKIRGEWVEERVIVYFNPKKSTTRHSRFESDFLARFTRVEKT